MTPDQVTTPESLEAVYSQYGWLGLVSGVTYLMLKLWRTGQVDAWLARALPGLQWEGRNRWWRVAIVFVLSILAAVTGAMVDGRPWFTGLPVGVAAGIGAIGLHETQQTIAKAASESISIRTAGPDAAKAAQQPEVKS